MKKEKKNHLHLRDEGLVHALHAQGVGGSEVVLVEERNERGRQNGVDFFRLKRHERVKLRNGG